MANHNHGHEPLKQFLVTVVMVPLPAQGHLNQLLHLSRLISSYNIPVHYVGFSTHVRQARVRVHGYNFSPDTGSSKKVHFHEFPTPQIFSPQQKSTTTTTPSHIKPSFPAIMLLRESVASLLRSLAPTSQRTIVIHDSLMASVVQDVVSIPNAESYVFHSVSAFMTFFLKWERQGRPFEVDPNILKELPSLEGCFKPEFSQFVRDQFDHLKNCSGYIYNTSRVIEASYISLLEKEQISGHNKKHWPLGPFNPISVKGSPQTRCVNQCSIFKWLDKQEPNSVLYVSFGTTTSLNDEQIKELATGLEMSGEKFIWVLRDADKDVRDRGERMIELPIGFEQRVEGRGMAVRDWAPQLEILEHQSTGGFMSHCGWNSCMESITMGVPILAWPMHSDQPRNTMLVTNLLKLGFVVREWGCRDEVVTASVVEKAVKKLIRSDEGVEVRKRAAELGGDLRRSVGEGGIARMELDSFVAHITR